MIKYFRRQILTVWIISFFSTITACKQVNVTVDKKGPKQIIVVLGSSTAAGSGLASSKLCWVSLLDSALQKNDTIINLAKGGYTTYHILPVTLNLAGRPLPDTTCNITKALLFKPKIIIINLPTNDIANGYTTEEYFNNINTLVSLAKRSQIKIYITTSQPRNLSIEKRKQLKDIRDKTIILYQKFSIDFWTNFATVDGNMIPKFGQGDGIHFNALGHRDLFRLAFNAMKYNRDVE